MRSTLISPPHIWLPTCQRPNQVLLSVADGEGSVADKDDLAFGVDFAPGNSKPGGFRGAKSARYVDLTELAAV